MEPLPPAKNLALLMHDVSRLLRRRLDREAAGIGLTSAQWRVLAYLARREGSNQASLADFMDMEPITLSRHLDRMEAAGMTERHPDLSDRRAHRLYLTASGRALITRFREVTSGIMDEWIAGISEAEIAAMTALLARMRGNLTGKDGEAEPASRPLPRKVSVG